LWLIEHRLAGGAARRAMARGARLIAFVLVLMFAKIALDPTPPARAEAPKAAFVWFPPSPFAGEVVSFASTATDATSPIVAWAWDLGGSGTFAESGSVITTTFPNSGSHVVRLRVTAADGGSSEAAETIAVKTRPLAEMLPFPIVRVVSTDRRAGIDLRLLSVEAPPGARVTVTCRGHGCPPGRQLTTVSARNAGSVTLTFPHLARFLRVGASIEIRVAKAGEIGKYTRIVVRSGRPPARFDACLRAAAPAPVNCPAVSAAPARRRHS
jgi:PKD repeat protein